jgi:PAS domain S-box-containing protein
MLKLLIFLLLVACHPGASAAEPAAAKNTLVIFSYDNQEQWSSSILLGLKSSKITDTSQLHVEYLDARRHQGDQYWHQFEQFLRDKYGDTPLDLAIVADNIAFDFILKIRPTFRPDLPVVFCGVNNFTPHMISGQNNISGVNEVVDITGTVNLALHLFPKASRLMVVAGSTGVGAVNRQIFQASIPSFSRPIGIEEFIDLQRTALGEKFSSISGNCLVLRLDNLREADGTNTPLRQSIEALAGQAPCPVFSAWDFDLDNGALGGIMVSGMAQGKKAGEMALELLKGRDPASMAVEMTSPNVPMFDFHYLQRFGVDVDALPENGYVVNLPPSFYDKFKTLIWAVIVVFIVMTGCIIALTSSLIARRKAEKALRASEELYRTYVDSAPVGIFIADAQGRYLDVNPQACRITGYQQSELLSMQIPDLLPPESMAAGKDHFERLHADGFATGELRYRRKNGEIRWWSVTASRVSDNFLLGFVSDVTDRRMQEESRSIFLELLDNAEHIVVFKDPQLRYLMINRSYTALTGLSLADVVGKTDREAFAGLSTESQIARYMEYDRQALTLPAGECLTIEEETLAADGSTKTFLSKKFPVYAQDGRLLGSGTITSEITEIKHMQQGLKQSVLLLTTLMDAVPADIYVMDPETYHILFINKNMQNHFGEDLVGKPCWQVFRHETAPCSCCRLPELLGENAPATVAWEDRNPVTGDLFINLETLITWPDGRRVKMQVATDITELRETKVALAESKERFRAIFEQAAIGICQNQLDGSFIHVNPRFSAITGYTPAELSRMTFKDITHAEDLAGDEAKISLLLAGKIDSYSLEKRYVKRDGSIIWVDLTVSLLRDSEGRNIHFIGFIDDISERKILQSQLQQAQKMESVGRLAGGVAHDFNNMLSVILGHTEMTLEQVAEDDPLYAELIEIQKAAQRSAVLTRQLLAYARKQAVKPKVLDLNATVEGMLKMLGRLIGENIELLWLPGKAVGAIKIDPSQIDQILANLCVNARDAIDGGGKVIIETGALTLDESTCLAYTEAVPGDYVVLTVSDNGRGMDQKTRAQIFEPFFTTKEIGKGTGLGLATVYGIIKQNKGFIEVKSSPGQGTRFRIYLPEHKEASLANPPSDRTEITAHGHETILLVEDEPSILAMTTTMLTRMGYKVLATAAPAEAIRLARESVDRIDLLMTDVVMPEMNGRDLASTLLYHSPGLKRLFMSGYTADVIAHHGVLDEGTHFIQKPFSRKELAAKVKEALAAEQP